MLSLASNLVLPTAEQWLQHPAWGLLTHAMGQPWCFQQMWLQGTVTKVLGSPPVLLLTVFYNSKASAVSFIDDNSTMQAKESCTMDSTPEALHNRSD